MVRKPFLMAAALSACVLAAAAWAAPIPVNNSSFEVLPAGGLPSGCGAGCSFSQDSIPGWLNTPFLGLGLSSGQFRPGTDAGNTAYFDSLSDGSTSAYTSTGCIEQTVGVAIQPGVTYTLRVAVGWQKGASPTGVPRLRVNGVYYDGVGTPVLGGWATFTTTYVGQAQDAGLPITICLSSVSNWGSFDDVRLSDSIAPTAVDADVMRTEIGMEARPNPFGAATRVRFSITRSSAIVLQVFDVSGRTVRTLLDGATFEAGSHEAIWDGTDDAGVLMGSGLYFLRIATGGGGRVERVLRVR